MREIRNEITISPIENFVEVSNEIPIENLEFLSPCE